MNPDTSFRRLSGLPLAMATLLTLSACGGGSSDSGPGAPPAAPNPPTAPVTPTPTPDPTPPPPSTPSPALITTQPSAQSVASGAAATFNVAASGSALSYQWLRNGVPVPQAASASYTVTASAAEDGAIYSVAVKNGETTVRSAGAALRLAGSKPPAMLGAIDTAYQDARAGRSSYASVAFAPTGELLLNINDGAATVRRVSAGTTTQIARYPGCVESHGMVADSAGNLYIACTQAVVKVARDGSASVFAGSLAIGAHGNVDGKGGAARFSMLSAIAIGGDGTLYVGDENNHNVRKIGMDGTVTTLAGGPTTLPDDGTGPVGFAGINGLAVDANNHVLVAERQWIRSIAPDGSARVVAGSTEPGARDGAALTARFTTPAGMVFDSRGNLFIVDQTNNAIRKLGTNGQVSTFAGTSGLPGDVRRDGTGAQASFQYPERIAIDGADNLYVTDAGMSALRRITPAAVVTTPFALPQQSSAAGFSDGAGAVARFKEPSGLSGDLAGNLYIADAGNAALRKMSPSGAVSTVARNLTPHAVFGSQYLSVSAAHDGSVYVIGATAARIDAAGVVTPLLAPKYTDWRGGSTTRIAEIAADRAGNRYEVIEEQAQGDSCTGSSGCAPVWRWTLRRVGIDGQVREWRAIDAPERGADFTPRTLTVDANGNLYLSEGWTNALWKLTPAGGWSLVGGVKQTAADALAVDARGTVYALDLGMSTTIRKITPGGAVTVLPGSTTPPLYKRASGLAPGIAVDADDRLWLTQGDAVMQLAQ